MSGHASRLAEQFRAIETDEDLEEELRERARLRRKAIEAKDAREQARYEIAHEEEADPDDVRVLYVKPVQFSSAYRAKYIIEGEPGVHYHSLGEVGR